MPGIRHCSGCQGLKRKNKFSTNENIYRSFKLLMLVKQKTLITTYKYLRVLPISTRDWLPVFQHPDTQIHKQNILNVLFGPNTWPSVWWKGEKEQ